MHYTMNSVVTVIHAHLKMSLTLPSVAKHQGADQKGGREEREVWGGKGRGGEEEVSNKNKHIHCTCIC